MALMKAVFLLMASGGGALPAFGASLEANCEAAGLRMPEKKRAVIVKGSLKTDPDKIAGGKDHLPAVRDEAAKHPGGAVYVPVGLKSEFFGQPGGTRLQISFYRAINRNNQALQGESPQTKTGLHEIFAYQTLIVNGIPISSKLDMPDPHSPASSRILLGYDRLDKPALISALSREDLALAHEPPVVLPEGEFLFVYSSCRLKYTAEKSK